MRPKDLREKIQNKTLKKEDIVKAIDTYNALVYERELTEALAAAYNNYLIESAKFLNMSIKELNRLALENHPSRYWPAKYS